MKHTLLTVPWRNLGKIFNKHIKHKTKCWTGRIDWAGWVTTTSNCQTVITLFPNLNAHLRHTDQIWTFLDVLWALWNIIWQILGINSLCQHTPTPLLTIKTMSHPTFCSKCLVFALLCDGILGLSSESKWHVTADNDDWNVSAQTITKNSCVSSVRNFFIYSLIALSIALLLLKV